MLIEALPLLTDNYAWLLRQPGDSACAVIDPAAAAPVRDFLAARQLSLRWILVTHHHLDHTGGVAELAVDGVRVVASTRDRARVPAVTDAVADGAILQVLGSRVEVLAVPGHTQGSLAYHLPTAAAVFTGDALFAAGCGRLLEGEPEQLYASLQRLAALPPTTQIFCGHEYTARNLAFAQSLDPGDLAVAARLREVLAARARGAATVPASLAVELATNPFLRAHQPALAACLGTPPGLPTFVALRRRRDRF